VAQLLSLGIITLMWHVIITALGIGYAVFIYWMLFDCVKYVEDRDERATEALYIALFGALFAPIYYFQKYLPRRRERLEKMNHDA